MLVLQCLLTDMNIIVQFLRGPGPQPEGGNRAIDPGNFPKHDYLLGTVQQLTSCNYFAAALSRTIEGCTVLGLITILMQTTNREFCKSDQKCTHFQVNGKKRGHGNEKCQNTSWHHTRSFPAVVRFAVTGSITLIFSL